MSKELKKYRFPRTLYWTGNSDAPSKSLIQQSLILGEMDGIILKIELYLVSTLILLHKLSKISIVSVFNNSQGLALNEYGFDVIAPTGHKSIRLPTKALSTKRLLLM